MTWNEFVEAVENQGVEGDDLIEFIDFDSLIAEDDDVHIQRSTDGVSIIVGI